MKKIQTSIVVLIFFSCYSFAQELSRRATFQASISSPNGKQPGAIIKSIQPSSPLLKAGLKAGDIIMQVNGEIVLSPDTWSDQLYALRGNNPTQLTVKRNGKTFDVSVMLNERAREQHAEIETFYDSFVSDYGIRQRVIITKPRSSIQRQPAILLIQGLSCSSIEKYPESKSNWARTINDLVEKSGMVVFRVEKPGVGDSEGACSETDFHTELNGYRNAAQMLQQLPYVDTTKIIVYGSSMGSALAPMLANEFNFAGIISDGTFFKTWFEHMLEIERRIRQMSGDTESEIAKKMNEGYIPLYFGMLIQKKSYQEIINLNPTLSQYNYHSPEHMYGRPMAYYHQLQELDLAGEWEKVKVPVRIMRGTKDWIMSSFDNEMIIEGLERNGHQNHQLYEFEGLDHWNTIHTSEKDSFEGKPGKWDDNISGIIINWAKELVKR